jgi:hypothetical protein
VLHIAYNTRNFGELAAIVSTRTTPDNKQLPCQPLI